MNEWVDENARENTDKKYAFKFLYDHLLALYI